MDAHENARRRTAYEGVIVNPKQQEVFNLLGYLPIEERLQLANNKQWDDTTRLAELERRVKTLGFVIGCTYAAVCILTWKVARP